MKKISMIILVFLLSLVVYFFEFQDKSILQPNYLYQVYLDDEILGVIESKDELVSYIDREGIHIKEKYNVDKVYPPNGLQIKKIITYSDKVDNVVDVYLKLKNLKPFTIEGYKFTIKREDEENKIVYTTSKEIFEGAITNTIETYVGSEEYDKYINEEQEQILTTGILVDDVYIEENVTVNEVRIPTNEKIFTDVNEMSKYILFGTTEESQKYIVKPGDTIQKIADNNQIGVEAFLISNTDLTSADNILYVGQEVSLAVPKPLVAVAVEYTSVEDQVNSYGVEEQTDSSMNIGDQLVVQEGEDGLNRVTSKIKKINGEISYALIKHDKTVVLKPAQNKIIKVGINKVSTIGSLLWWKWPTAGGFITTPYGYRTHPIYGYYQFHQALDIAGPGYGSPIYASNNGVVIAKKFSPKRSQGGNGYGNYVIINHNNGYYTLYAHLSGFVPSLQEGSTVSRGQIIGYMGTTGDASGPHLHYELWTMPPWSSGSSGSGRPVGNINPYSVSYH